jgi:D-arabinose 1-dehydrogenase-like Zn-dependent alcohol dehydrogenase
VRALRYDSFGGPVELVEVGAPEPGPADVVVAVTATGVCRSDWHGWQGHDSDITPPQIPGHELAGAVVAVGRDVRGWRGGERVTVPFVCACGRCAVCRSGNAQVCPNQRQPGFTDPGSFAEQVLIPFADTNLVALPDGISDVAAAALGCRFATSWRAVTVHGDVHPGDVVLVLGLGGVGLAAAQIARAAGARVIGLDPSPAAVAFATTLGLTECSVLDVDAAPADIAADVVARTGGAHVGIDAVGTPRGVITSVLSLRRRGRHVQVGLLPAAGGPVPVPMDRVISYELALLGSHGMPAAAYPDLLAAVVAGRVDPAALVTRRVDLAAGAGALTSMVTDPAAGITVIEPGRHRTDGSPGTGQTGRP